MTNSRIVIADDHCILRDGLRRLLEAEPGFAVVGEASDAATAVRLVKELDPDVLLLDMAMPDASGIAVLRQLQQTGCSTRTILLTASIERQDMVEALLLGVRGLVLKESAAMLLFRAIRAVLMGQYWLGHDRTTDVIEALRRYGAPPQATPAQTLTPRETSIVAAVVNGSSNRDIAEQLGISEQTVKNHVSNVFDKVGVSNRLELALYAIHHRLLEKQMTVGSAPGASLGGRATSSGPARLAPPAAHSAADADLVGVGVATSTTSAPSTASTSSPPCPKQVILPPAPRPRRNRFADE